MTALLSASEAAELRIALDSIGVRLEALLEEPDTEVALFGSRAVGLQRPGSDWDIVCTRAGRSRHSRSVDLLFVTPAVLESNEWLGSEIAQHIARYGRWIAGKPAWAEGVFASGAAVDRKRRLIEDRAALVHGKWQRLGPVFRERHATLLRRDLQRLVVLAQGYPVPPTPVLDDGFAPAFDPVVPANASLIESPIIRELVRRDVLECIRSMLFITPSRTPIGGSEVDR